MSPRLLSLSPDLQRLSDEGYFIQIKGGLLLVREVPYVDAQRQVRTGTLISTLALAGDVTQRPDTHVIYFDGDHPCAADGSQLPISHQSQAFDLGGGVKAKHSFSSKPAEGYADYYEKMSAYASMLAGPATTLDPAANPRTYRTPDEDDEDAVFNYMDNASARSGVGALSDRLSTEQVAFAGLGGTGAYILDFVAKTPVAEIRLFDDDEFLQHNAFRGPGAPSLEELRGVPKKVEYWKGIYSRMHRRIVAHPVRLTAENLELLDGITFVFICMDAGAAKRSLIAALEERGVPFIDVGMGLELVDGSLGGILRVTASTPEKRDHVHGGRISFADDEEPNLYGSNIQVADLNALNATLAVIKWKKIRGFYRDLEKEHHCTYTTDGNMLINGDQP